MLGHIGVPIHKMICSEDGHIVVSLLDQKENCSHNKNTKDCCKSIKKETSTCCDYSSDFIQLHESSLVKEVQTKTNHFLNSTAFLFNQFTYNIVSPSNQLIKYSSPPLCKLKQTIQSIIQSFII
jgi:hypothetical protein